MHSIRYFVFIGIGLLGIAVNAQEPQITNSRHIHDRIVHYRIDSPALNKTTSFTAVFPVTYSEGGEPSPVVYLLHGAGRNHFTLTDFETTREDLLQAPFVTIMPYGEGGWWIDSPAVNFSKYETFIEEIITVTKSELNLVSGKSKCGITGWSMGGFGAVHYAERHPQQFTAAAAILGLLDFPNPELPPEQNHNVPSVFGSTESTQVSFNPLPHASNLKGMNIFLITGNRAFDFTMNENFDQKLTELNIAHEYVVLEGAHTFDIVEESLPRVIDFFESVFAEKSACSLAPKYQ